MIGVKLIAQERLRQIDEGWTAEHDQRHHDGSLAVAGAWYAMPQEGRCAFSWPWDCASCKPDPNRIRELVKAGALIAAEIDRLLNNPAPDSARKAVEGAA